jgi:SagB-type dehydrogenase family enzyme
MKKIIALVLLFAAAGFAGTVESIVLPKPQTEGGKPLMQALSQRQSARAFSEEKLSPQMLSNLLWAAFGVNRPDGKRTAPSAMNWQEVQIYVVMAEGAYLYDAKSNRLEPAASGDFRGIAGTQNYVAAAPLNLVYVSDGAKTTRASEPDRSLFAGADVGFIAQNVYLFCASEGLATVVRGSVNRAELAKALKLTVDQKIVLAQTVGYPKH